MADRSIEATSGQPEETPGLSTARRWGALLVFCVFAGLIAETFLTPSTAPLVILQRPYIVPFNMLLYGSFDVVAREIMVRRRVRLASVVLLGAAYGFINEGVAAGTWYVVHPAGYILIGGIDWAWALSLTLFHAVISVLAPIAFIEILFPSIAGRSLAGKRGVIACVVTLYACVAVAIVVLAAEPLPIFPDRLTVLVVATGFTLLAVALPERRTAAAPTLHAAPSASATPTRSTGAPVPTPKPPGLWRLRVAGFLTMFAFFFLNIVFPQVVVALLRFLPGLRTLPDGILIAQGIDFAVFLAFGALVFWRGWTWSQRPGWSPRQNLALLLGGVAFTTLLLNITEAEMGEVYATLPFFALLIALSIRWRWRQSASQPAGQPARPERQRQRQRRAMVQ